MKPLQHILYVLAAVLVLLLAGVGLGDVVHRIMEVLG